MNIFTAGHILPAAFILDLILGDPYFLPHPIRWMGKAITYLEPLFRRFPFRPLMSGALFCLTLIACTWGLTFILTATAKLIHSEFSLWIEILLIYYSLSARSLEKAATDVCSALSQNSLADAKKKVGLIVGRDVENLSAAEITRATVETVAENLVDGVISPLFFAAIGGAPLAMAYKMVNTLDSMIGYKNERYQDFGKVAARIDDIANYIPARISVAIISFGAQILAGKGFLSFKTAVQEGTNHSSPNSGYPEAAFSGALGVKLGGSNQYFGRLVKKPYIGVRFGPANINHIQKACDLMILASLLWASLLWAIITAGSILL
ncbi:MAG: cobalamin biosynthesis protein CobD [Deltaproteobacteria bacterium]|nr:MAG: cobalamin biosynthesis protein CobD [Deltaproteobacteria bacterium]